MCLNYNLKPDLTCILLEQTKTQIEQLGVQKELPFEAIFSSESEQPAHL